MATYGNTAGSCADGQRRESSKVLEPKAQSQKTLNSSKGHAFLDASNGQSKTQPLCGVGLGGCGYGATFYSRNSEREGLQLSLDLHLCQLLRTSPSPAPLGGARREHRSLSKEQKFVKEDPPESLMHMT